MIDIFGIYIVYWHPLPLVAEIELFFLFTKTARKLLKIRKEEYKSIKFSKT